MSFTEGNLEHKETGVEDTLERRAAALVNPASGLANDFLNVYNEILMLIEMLPDMPDLIDDIAAWRPASYRAYFLQSQLPGRERALNSYSDLDPAFRALFDAAIEQLAGLCVEAVERIERAMMVDGAAETIGGECARATARIRPLLDSAAQLVSFGRHKQGADVQTMVSVIFSAA